MRKSLACVVLTDGTELMCRCVVWWLLLRLRLGGASLPSAWTSDQDEHTGGRMWVWVRQGSVLVVSRVVERNDSGADQ